MALWVHWEKNLSLEEKFFLLNRLETIRQIMGLTFQMIFLRQGTESCLPDVLRFYMLHGIIKMTQFKSGLLGGQAFGKFPAS